MEKQGNQIPLLWTLFGCLQICQIAYEPTRTSSGHSFYWYIHKTFYNILGIFCELTSNMCAQNLSLWAHKQIDIFEGIQKEFIAAVFDSLASPTNLPCHLSSNSSLLLSRHRLDTLLEKNNKLYIWRPREVRQPRQLPWLEFLTNAKGNLSNVLTLLFSLSVYRHSSFNAVLLYRGILSNAVFFRPKTALNFHLTRFFKKNLKKKNFSNFFFSQKISYLYLFQMI